MDILHGFGPLLLEGALVTVQLALLALVIGTAIGGICCWLQFSSWRVLRAVGFTYVSVVRGIPDLLVVFAVYFGGSMLLATLFDRYVEVNAFAAGAFALALSFGAFVAEIMRGALLSVHKGQSEAAFSLGLTPLQSLLLVRLPQAARMAVAPFGNQAIVLLKQTSIVSIVGCNELMRNAAEASGATREPFTMYMAVACIYLVLTGCTALILGYAENRAERSMAR